MRLLLTALSALALAACTPPANTEAPAQSAEIAAREAPSDLASVAAPAEGARVTSPLSVTGVAPANWYFENQFPVRLLDAQGEVIAEGPAHPRVNWTANAEPKEFDAELSFTVSADTAATLVLQEDMPGDGETPREVRLPVTLAPN
jgi:hypothetical protein